MLLGEDMFDVETGSGKGGVRDVAVFASSAGPFADELALGPLHR